MDYEKQCDYEKWCYNNNYYNNYENKPVVLEKIPTDDCGGFDIHHHSLEKNLNEKERKRDKEIKR